MKLKSFAELGAALPCPASPEASALVRGADELLAQLDGLASAAREARNRAAGAADTISILEARARAAEDQLAQAQGLAAFMGDEAQVLQALGAQAEEMREMAQELRGDPAVRAYLDERAAEEAARQEAVAETRERLHALLRQAADVLAQGGIEKASGLIGEIKTKAKAGGLAAEFVDRTAELESIVAQARAAVKAREEARAEEQSRQAFGRWLRGTVLPVARFDEGDVVITLGLGQARHLRPRVTRRGHVVWDELSCIGVESKGLLSTVSPRAKVWDWRRQAPRAARTLAEAERRARAIAEAEPSDTATVELATRHTSLSRRDRRATRPQALKVAEAAAAYETTPAGTSASAVVASAQQDAPAGADSPDDGSADLDSAIVQALQEAAAVAPGSVVATAIDEALAAAADEECEAEGPHLVVFEAEDQMAAAYWANAVAEILSGLGHEAIGATVALDTPQVVAHGLVLDADEGLEVEVTVNGRLLATPQSFASRSAVKAQARREQNVTVSLRRQLARALSS